MRENPIPEPVCADCGKETQLYIKQKAGKTEYIAALCDSCSADRAVAAAFRGTSY